MKRPKPIQGIKKFVTNRRPAINEVVREPTAGGVVFRRNDKTKEVEILFNLIEHIRDNWIYYSALYKFNSARYRNDYAFSIACHIMGGHGLDKFYTELPAPILFTDKDKLVKISECGSLTFLMSFNEGRLAKTHGQDIHMMNKYDILDNIDELMELSR